MLETKNMIVLFGGNKFMKRKNKITTKRCLAAILAAGLTVSMLAGCGNGKSGAFVVDQSDAIITITEDKDTSDIVVNVENPWVDTDKEGVLAATGLDISVPAEATEVKYSYMKTSNIAQATFKYKDNNDWTFRMQKADMIMDISGLYYGWTSQEEVKVSGKEAMMYAYAEGQNASGMLDDMFGVQLVNWYDDTKNITYSLSVSGKNINGIDLQAIVENHFVMGNIINPMPYSVDINNIDNGIYSAAIDKSGIKEADGKLTVTAEIYTEEDYDIVDINRMAEGDVIYINGQTLTVNSISRTDSGIIEVNGGIENGGSALIAVDESNCFVYAGMDMERSYTLQGVTSLAVSKELKLTDKYDPSEDKVYTGSDAVMALKEIVEKDSLTCYDCVIMVEKGEIIEITRLFRP